MAGMRRALANPTYRALFAAQIVALTGTGLMTVALALLAYDLAGEGAGTVLGTAFFIKMVAYVGVAPLAGAMLARLPRKGVLIAADLIRAATALALPFIATVWQIYLLIFLLQAASASFTPTFQATIPDILTDEDSYTRALSLSRLAYDLENILSPLLAGALLSVMGYHWLFAGTAAGFLGSAALVRRTAIPAATAGAAARPFLERLTRGARIYLATPRLRGLLALTLAGAGAGAVVLVGTVVAVRGGFGRGEGAVAVAFAAYGAGSMAAALALPGLLERAGARPVMLAAAALLALTTLGGGAAILSAGLPGWAWFLVLWAALGLGSSALFTPSGRLLRRSSHEADRPALFAAHFALSHGCWLIAYPLAGWTGTVLGMGGALAVAGVLVIAGAAGALTLWPRGAAGARPHAHPDLPAGHPHLRAHGADAAHRHEIIIDALHPRWPPGAQAFSR